MVDVAAQSVRLERLEGGRLVRVVLDCGRGNVIGSRAVADLRAAVAEVAREREPVALVLDHAGNDFSWGASVEEHLPGKVESFLPAFHALARELVALPLPILCCVRGRCLGGGLELAALAERIFAAPDAQLGQPEVKLGVFAPLASLLLPRIVGEKQAADLLLTGRTIAASDALRLGLVAEIAPDPGEAALAWAREHLVPKSSAAVRHATRALRAPWARKFEARLAELERLYLEELLLTHDATEGLRAFLEKRSAQWRHR